METVPADVTKLFLRSLNRTRFFTETEMIDYQRTLLEPLLLHARKEVPFYEKRLNGLFNSDDEINWDAWHDLPTLTRAEAKNAGESLHAKNLPAQVGSVSSNSTSGSTGRPLTYKNNSISSIVANAIGQRLYDEHGINPDQSIAFILLIEEAHAYPEGSFGTAWNIHNPNAPAYNLAGNTPIRQQLEWLQRRKPGILNTYPSICHELGQEAVRQGCTLPFKVFIAHGEVLEPDTREYLEERHSIKVIDRYGASEVGPISAQCSESKQHHSFPEIILTEALDLSSNRTIRSGTGRLVVTPFYNYAMPFIRYENEDLVELPDQPCCGKVAPTFNKILGRQLGGFTFEDGTKLWPFIHMDKFSKFIDVEQVQYIQHTSTEVEIRYVPGVTGRADKDGLERFLCNEFNNRISIKLSPMNAIPRTSAGKYQRWLSYV